METISRLFNRLMLMIGGGYIQSSNDAGNVQLLQVQLSGDETRDAIPRVAEYGFTSNPPAQNATAVVIFIGGERASGVAVATGHEASRLKNLQPGEMAIYDDQGQSIYLTRAGIVINGANLPIVIQNTPSVHIKGALNVDGNVTSGGDLVDASGKSLAQARTVFNPHTHTDPQGGITGGPSASM